MDVNSIIILGLCVIIFIMLILLHIKDNQTNKKFDRYDHVVNDNMSEIFILKKNLNELKESIDSLDIINIAEEIDKLINEKMDEKFGKK